MSTSANHSNSSPVALSIAGFDPSGGAGILADLKTFAAHNCYGVAAITALTIQNTQGLTGFDPVPAKHLKACIASLSADGHISAIKVGMLATRANAEVVAAMLNTTPAPPSVLDPVFRSSDGVALIDESGLRVVRDHLLSCVSVVTPNLDEAEALTGAKVSNVDQMKVAAQKLVAMGARAVVITGGHLEKPVDVYYEGDEPQVFAGDRVRPDQTHGTGCTFSAAVAANLALGRQLADSVMLAKAYVTEAIKKAYPIGPGRVPLNHLYRLQEPSRTTQREPALAEAAP